MQKHHEVSSKINKTALKKLIALADGKLIFRDAEAIGAIYGFKGRDAVFSPGQRKREAFWKRVEPLKQLEQRYRRRQRGRSWLYSYLDAILKFHARLKGWQRHDLLWFYVPYHTVAQHEHHYNALRVLIDISSSADAKSRSRWTQALRYAWRERESWQPEGTLRAFFEANGGVSGCARKIARPRKKKRHRPLRVWA